MGTKIDFDMMILGGLSVHVKATMAPAEPDVGILHSYIDDYELFVYGKGGRRMKKAWRSLYLQIDTNVREREQMEIAAQEALTESAAYDYDEQEE